MKGTVVGEENGKEILFYHLSNGVINVVLTNYGATIVRIDVPGRDGQYKNVVAGFNSFEEYKKDKHYLGCTVGRFANRIAFGKFSIEGKEYQLECNNGLNHLHGGCNGFNKKTWTVENDNSGLIFHYFSEDGEEGYPGNLSVSVKFSFGEDNKFLIEYAAATDMTTILSLTNHSYFNLSGFDDPTIYKHMLKINAENYTIKNSNNIPSGEIATVAGTAYDFRISKALGKDIDSLITDMGYDINYVLKQNTNNLSEPAAELYEPVSGRLLKVFTDRPGLQVYTANWWDGETHGSQNRSYRKHGAVALETQAFPDAPNHLNFPGVLLHPSGLYNSKTVFQFLTL